VRDVVRAFKRGLLPDPMNDACYYNIRTMQAISLK